MHDTTTDTLGIRKPDGSLSRCDCGGLLHRATNELWGGTGEEREYQYVTPAPESHGTIFTDVTVCTRCTFRSDSPGLRLRHPDSKVERAYWRKHILPGLQTRWGRGRKERPFWAAQPWQESPTGIEKNA